MAAAKSPWAKMGTFMLGSSARSLNVSYPVVIMLTISAFAPSSMAFSASSMAFLGRSVMLTV